MPVSGTETSKTQTARKDYLCIECQKPIKKGDKYWYFKAVYPGQGWEKYKTCLKCKRVRDLAEAKYDFYPEEGPAFGELYYWIKCKLGLC